MAILPVQPSGGRSKPLAEPEHSALIASGKVGPTAIRKLRCRTVANGRFQQWLAAGSVDRPLS
jgi:hypothetical protein